MSAKAVDDTYSQVQQVEKNGGGVVKDRALAIIHFGLVWKEEPKRAPRKGEDLREGG